MRGRILVIDHKTPTPDADSGSASMFSYMSILARAGFDLTFVPMNFADDGRYSRALNELGIKTLSAPEWTTIEAVIEAYAPGSDVVLIYRAPVARRVLDLVRQTAPGVRILLHATDLHFLRMEREAALSGSPAHAAAARDMRAIELPLIARADASIVVSTYEHELLSALLPEAVIHRIPIMRDTPPRRRGLSRLLSGNPGRRRGVVFIGSYPHTPNVDAVHWFVREVWPLLQARHFAHRFVIAGSNMPEDIAALSADTIEVRGYVKDLAALFARCRISVAPLRYGAGIKGKIVSSLSHGVPVVATRVAAEGMELRAGEEILVADHPTAMADQIEHLCRDAELWRRLSDNGYKAFQRRFSIQAGERAVLDVVDGLVATTRGA